MELFHALQIWRKLLHSSLVCFCTTCHLQTCFLSTSGEAFLRMIGSTLDRTADCCDSDDVFYCRFIEGSVRWVELMHASALVTHPWNSWRQEFYLYTFD